MKILYLHQYFNTPEMSGGTRSYEMARRLVAMGHEVHMVTSWRESRDDQAWFENEVEGIHIHWLPVAYSNNMSYGQRIKAFLKFAFSSAKKAASIKADVVFATSTPLTIALPAVYAAKKQEIPLVFEVRDLWPELPIAMGALKNPALRFLAQRLENFAYNHSASVVALSPGMKEGVVKTGYPAENVAVIPNSSDISLFQVDNALGIQFRQQRDWLGDKPLLVYAGTFGAINGVGYMVTLAKALGDIEPNVRILLVGGGAEFDKVKALATEAEVLNKNLFMEASLPKKDIPALLNAATMASSLFIDLPEMQPNSANKFFDALAAGKPIMINYGGWQKELLDASGAGLVTWKMSSDETAQAIANVINDQAWSDNASRASFDMANRFFSRDVLAQQLNEVLIKTQAGKANEVAAIAPGKYE